ncbi:diacylglycerol kinase family protein [Leptolyngbya sp. FACHB-711]|uniref:diacylglycerol kinase family protein n=1 Tax=unclassified Leptolyngbya TaxID=2650499 RepID=UPI00168A03DA|nr:diacylglycerol kinase family protein [Leptolyngbya sp. FACHB-711]MBD1849175.1 diacylglycerol kinase family protein [Cyanobacteria bacterium FACHB-502]MBD2024939.1 diacylglycerol kinase family protein [Leptolyngbya sp. FACHB-711]
MTQNLSTEAPPRQSVKPSPNRSLSWRVASNLFVSFRYAWAGLSYTFQTQRNFRIHLAMGTVALLLSILLGLSRVEIAIIGLTSGVVLTMELLNTAIESVVDLTVRQTYHELAKIAKDCAAGAVLVSALAAVIVAGSLLLPPLLEVVRSTISLPEFPN